MTGSQIETLRDALCSAFDQDALDQMLRLRLDKDREQLAGSGSLQRVVFKVVEVAVREGWHASLIRAAVSYNPGNLPLRRFCDENPGLVTAGGQVTDARPPGVAPSPERQKLEYEIDHRLRLLPVLLQDSFTYTQLHTAKGAILGQAEHHPRVGKLGEFEPLFPEFRGTSLFSLFWALLAFVPEPDRERVDRQLASARELPQFFDKFVLLAPVGEEDSKWQVDRGHIDRLQSGLRVLSGEETREEPKPHRPDGGP